MRIYPPLCLGAMCLALATPSFATTVPVTRGATVTPSGGPSSAGDSVSPAEEIDSMFDNGGDGATSDAIKINRSIAIHAGPGAAAHGNWGTRVTQFGGF